MKRVVRLAVFVALLTLAIVSGHPAQAQVASGNPVPYNNWWRNCASLDMDFVHDQYYINHNTTCDGTVGTTYSGAAIGTNVQNFISGTGATFTRAGSNVTSVAPPFYLTSPQSWVSRAATTNNITSTFAPFYTNSAQGQTWASRAATVNHITATFAPFYTSAGQTWVSRADSTAVATYFDSTGTLQTAASGTARSATYSYNGTSWVANSGTLIEPAATNRIRNNTMQGAAAGSPGTNPTNWSTQNLTGFTFTIVGTGTENGINYVDYQISGTPTASGSDAIFLETPTGIAASSGQIWTASVYAKLVSGSLSNVSNLVLGQQVYNSSGTYLQGAAGTALSPTSANLSTQRYLSSYTIANGSTAYVRPLVAFTLTSGQAVNFTLRVGMPQMELSNYATSVIATSGSVVTRPADVYNQEAATYFDGTGTLQTAASGTARSATYSYNGSSWVANSGTLIEPAATNLILYS
ncbi:MAG: hypothetical protein KGI37_11295, partial [Alphaproteobacteria bacterium]|nr:hypothetical protein [Alphaproteobacteria bacterium]